MGLIFILVVVFVVLAFPVYVIGRRGGVKNPWVAFLPVLGVWIVLFETIGKSGWYSLLGFVPYVGGLVILIWTAVELPARHDRSRWWIVPLIVPGVNLLAYWFYAFTLPREAPTFA
ncbi:MAG: hypothetical protein ACJ74M_01715 [Gaiellaceae bacterium]|jgi:hypothetical protein